MQQKRIDSKTLRDVFEACESCDYHANECDFDSFDMSNCKIWQGLEDVGDDKWVCPICEKETEPEACPDCYNMHFASTLKLDKIHEETARNLGQKITPDPNPDDFVAEEVGMHPIKYVDSELEHHRIQTPDDPERVYQPCPDNTSVSEVVEVEMPDDKDTYKDEKEGEE